MSNISQSFGSSGNLTITLDGLTQGSVRQSSPLDIGSILSGNSGLDVELTLSGMITVSPGNQNALNWYLAGSIDGTQWPELGGNNSTALGTGDGPYTGSLVNLSQMRSLQFTSANIPYATNPQSISTTLGIGKLVKKIVAVVENQTGQTLDSNNNHNVIKYQVVFATNT